MKMLMNNKKGLGVADITKGILVIIGIVVIFLSYSVIVPTAQSSGDSLGDQDACSRAGGFFNTSQSACLNGTSPADTATVNFSSIPLSTLFSGAGVIFVIVMASLILLVIRSVFSGR